jgi:hypothetical protein
MNFTPPRRERSPGKDDPVSRRMTKGGGEGMDMVLFSCSQVRLCVANKQAINQCVTCHGPSRRTDPRRTN